MVAGDDLLVLAGEIVPVDCTLASRRAVLDEAALTGEPLPVRRERGDEIRSGASVVGEAIEVRALRAADSSTYARIVRLVESAEADRPRTARLADRAAVVFLPITLAVAALGWVISGSPVAALAVLVVATPCPLILATPIAFVSGLARAARRGVVVKGGTPLERLGAATVVVFDKTGTLTTGHPRVIEATTTCSLQPRRPSSSRRIRWLRRFAPRRARAGLALAPAASSTRPTATASRRASAAGGRAWGSAAFAGADPDRPALARHRRGVGRGRRRAARASSAAPIGCATTRRSSSTAFGARARGRCC